MTSDPPRPIAEVIAIGDELTSGQRLDTNSQWLSQRLSELGIRTLYHTTVGDDLAANVDVFRLAVARAEIVVCTGGLGPTADDLTRQAVAAATGNALLLDEAALQAIETLFAHRGRPMPPQNRAQAMFPAGSRVVPNPHGSAPGIDLTVPRDGGGSSRIFALPGVPAEMREMWIATVEPQLLALQGGSGRTIRSRRIQCFGVGESELEQRLPDLIRRGRQPTVGITVSQATITLRITAEAATPEQCFAAIEPTAKIIYDCLGDLIFGEGDDQLEHAVVRLLEQSGQSLSVVECGTGGLIGHWLSDADPAGHIFRGGMLLRDRDAARRALAAAEASGDGDHAAAVQAMARSCRERFETDYGLAVGPAPDSRAETSATPEIRFALATAEGVVDRAAAYVAHPDILKPRAAKQALNLLRRHLLQTA